MAIDQDVGVQFVEIELAGEYLLLKRRATQRTRGCSLA